MILKPVKLTERNEDIAIMNQVNHLVWCISQYRISMPIKIVLEMNVTLDALMNIKRT